MPPRSVLAGLLALFVLPPFVARASGTFVGSFAMFRRIERYHLDIRVREPRGERALPLVSLAPHLSREQREILLPAGAYAPGADQVDLVASGLVDIARLACAVDVAARSVRVVLTRAPFDRPDAKRQQSVELSCVAR